MEYCNTVVGLDVHKKMIVAGILPPGSERKAEKVRFENHPKTIEKFVTRVASRGPVEFVYECPDAWGDLDHLESSFYDRQRWLPD